ncbi:MAG: PP2C family protein-serine/threonine phosphatase [Acidimicrobiales bacterium]
MDRAAGAEPIADVSGQHRRRARNALLVLVFLAFGAGVSAGFLVVREQELDHAERLGAEPELLAARAVVAAGGAGMVVLTVFALAGRRHRRHLARANALLARSEERGRAIQDVAGRLARALTGGEVVAAVVDHLPSAVGARSVIIAVVGQTGQLEVLGREGVADVAPTQFPAGAVARSIVGAKLAEDEPAWLSSSLGWRGDDVADALAEGGSALALLPLSADDVSGVLAVAYPRIRIFAEDEQALLQTVSLLAARALARGRRYDDEHQTALAFQRAALPDELPSVDGLTIAARYRPATQRATVGGDWYDALVLDDRRLVFVVGDVVGHGLVAAAAMGRLRTAFRAIARLSSDPGEMLRAMNLQVDSIPDSFCTTVVCTVIDLATGTMTWSRSGHPPPVVLDADGPHLLDEPGLPPLGVAPAAPARVHTHALGAGDRVILYTDGIVERRGESIDVGLRRLGVVAENLADLEPEEFADALVEALVPADEQSDDLAVLVIRFDGCGVAPTTERARVAMGG